MKAGALCALAFLATAVLVAVGVFHGLDQYAVSHWMPYLRPKRHRLITLDALLAPGREGPLARRLIDIWIFPASVLVSGAVVAYVGWRARSLAWPILWVAGNAVDVAGKLIVERPTLYRRGIHVSGFDHSLPSGHTIRAFLVAGAVAWLWRRGRWAYGWAATVPVALVVGGHHVPMDVVAGMFAAGALVLSLRALRGAS